MILTTSLINTTVLRAYCVLGAKAIKYYTGLALGKNNTCLFREMTLLRVSIDILKNFKIVGSTIPCDCCIEGDYKVILPNDKIYYFQFSCDNKGYLVTEDDGGYDFIYSYDETHKQLVMVFNDGDTIIRFDNVNFTEECNFTYTGSFPWYYISELEVGGDPVLSVDGLITIQDPLGNDVVPPLVIPGALLADPQDVVDYWNANRDTTNFTLSFNGIEYVMESPADFINYFNYTFNFTQAEGSIPIPGVNATASCTNTQIGNKNEGNILKAYVDSVEIGSYTIVSGDTSDTAAQLAVKLENTFTYAGTSVVVGANINLTAPVDGTAYNGTVYELKMITPEILPVTPEIIFNDTGGNSDSFQVILQPSSLLLGQVNNTGLLTPVQLAAAICASINSGTHGFTAIYLLSGDSFVLESPIGTGDFYNGFEVTLQCNPNPGSTIETTVYSPAIGTRTTFFSSDGKNEVIVPIDSDVFTGGTDPVPSNVPVTYTSEFDIVVDDELTYENLNPCVPEVVKLTCLSNDQVKQIINNVNKIIK